jgi:hypothetical protein
MRTTIRLDEQLLREAKQMAARTGRTLTAVIEDALRAALARSRQRSRRNRLDLPTFRGNGLVAGVDLDDTAALLDVMDRRGDPD